MFWIKNTDGKQSASLTFATTAFVVVMINFILSMFEHIGPLRIRAFDSAAVASLLMPLFALYFGRRYTSDKFSMDTLVHAVSGASQSPGQTSTTVVVKETTSE